MLVQLVKDWNYPSNFFRQVPNNGNVCDGIEFTEEAVEECDYLIVLQRPPYDIKVNCREGNTWLITQEPPVDYFRFYQNAFPYFDKVFTYYKNDSHSNVQSMQPVLPWHVNKSYDELAAIDKRMLSEKQPELSWITSNKNDWPGHQARMMLKDTLLDSDLPFRLMGNGFAPIEDKFDGLFPYKYALAIENYSCANYWTEKLADCFLSWCLPFYWGAPNILEYFPKESFISIDPTHPNEALEIIKAAIADNEWENRIEAISEARNRVLNRYQFFPYIANMIKQDLNRNETNRYKRYTIPANPYPKRYKIRNQVKYYRKRIANYLQIV